MECGRRSKAGRESKREMTGKLAGKCGLNRVHVLPLNTNEGRTKKRTEKNKKKQSRRGRDDML